MILVRYISRRLLLYYFLINGSLALLYNVVEFFEKFIRTKETSFSLILTFLAINILPTFFDLAGVSSWISSCLLLRELQEKGEWESLLLMGISFKRLLKVFLITGLLLSSISFIGKEFLIMPLEHYAEEIRLQRLPRKKESNLYNQWITNGNEGYIHFDHLNLTTQKGEGISLIYLTPFFELETFYYAPFFSYDAVTQKLILAEVQKTSYAHKSREMLPSFILNSPYFFFFVKNHTKWKNIFHHISNIKAAQMMNSRYFLQQEVGSFLEKFLKHLLPLIYCLSTFLLFLLCYSFEYLRWFALVLPYPFMLLSVNICSFLLHHHASAVIVIIPYLLVALFIIFGCSMLMRTPYINKD